MPTTENHLIRRLPRGDRKRLLALCESVDLVTSTVLCEPHEPVRHVHFPVVGFVSLVVGVDQYSGLEVGMIGREGMVGGELLLHSTTTPWRVVVQSSGHAWRVPALVFRKELVTCAALDRLVRNYLAFRIGQLAMSAACERFHAIGPRLARWLLMSQDRAYSDAFDVTHETLALMLGVRRVGVTVAAGRFQRLGLIGYSRGHVHVLDRAALELEACSCYASNAAVFSALMR